MEWQEIFQLAPHKFYGPLNLKAGISFAHSSYDGDEQFQPVNIVGVAGYPLRRIEFSAASTFSIQQNKVAWFVGDK